MIYFKLYDMLIIVINGVMNIKVKGFKFIIVINMLDKVWFVSMVFVLNKMVL